MPLLGRVARAERSWPSARGKGVVSLFLTVILCLPSLVGGAALLINVLLHRNINQWGQALSALVAFGVFFGTPLVALAAVVGGITALSGRVLVEIKYAQLLVSVLAAIATASLWLQFGM